MLLIRRALSTDYDKQSRQPAQKAPGKVIISTTHPKWLGEVKGVGDEERQVANSEVCWRWSVWYLGGHCEYFENCDQRSIVICHLLFEAH